MPNYICVTCGVQFAPTETPPEGCPICQDERQYINPNGQTWTTLEALKVDRHNLIKPLEPGLTGIGTEPRFAIGQRPLLVQGVEGNVLWDCSSFSYPNQIPLPASTVNRIVEAVKPFEFDRLYGGWFDLVVSTDAKAAVERSAARYVRMISQ